MEPMSLEEFGSIVALAMETLPEKFQPYLDRVVVDVEETSDERAVNNLGDREEDTSPSAPPYGIIVPPPISYSGAPHEGFVASDPGDWPHRIILYKSALEEAFPVWEERALEIRRTVIRLLAGLLGYSESELERFNEGRRV